MGPRINRRPSVVLESETMRTCKILCVSILFPAASCGQPPESGRLNQLVGEYDLCGKTVGIGGSYTGNVGSKMKIESPNPNAIAFKDTFEVGDAFPRATEVAEAQLRFDPKMRQYLFDFKTTVYSKPHVIKEMVLTYADDAGWRGTGEISIGDQRVPATVSISFDAAKRESAWNIMVPNPSDPKVPRESYTFNFGRRSAPAKK